MFSALSSYIWGDQNENEEPLHLEACERESDWIFVEKKEHGIDGARMSGRVTRTPQKVDFDLDKMELIGLASMEESWYLTPPSCFNVKKRDGCLQGELHASQFENLLIEHPSMSVYGPTTVVPGETDHNTPVASSNKSVVTKRNKSAKLSFADAAKLQIFANRRPLQELKESNSCSEQINKKVAKRANLVHNRTRNQHKRKVRSRADSRRVVQLGKRGS